MSPRPESPRRIFPLFAGIGLSLLSAFFVLYTVRLIYITHGLQSIRPGGQGAYVGAVVFPLLAVLLGWGGWRCLRAWRGPAQSGEAEIR